MNAIYCFVLGWGSCAFTGILTIILSEYSVRSNEANIKNSFTFKAIKYYFSVLVFAITQPAIFIAQLQLLEQRVKTIQECYMINKSDNIIDKLEEDIEQEMLPDQG